MPPPAYRECPDDCNLESFACAQVFEGYEFQHQSTAGEKFRIVGSTKLSRGDIKNFITVHAETANGSERGSITILTGIGNLNCHYFFHAPSSKMVLMTGLYLHIWHLSAQDKKVGTLEMMWKFVDDKDHRNLHCETIFDLPSSCVHGDKMTLQVVPPVWYDRDTFTAEKAEGEIIATDLSIPYNEGDEYPFTEKERVQLGLRGLIELYLEGDVSCRSAIVEYLKPKIRPASTNETSCIIDLVNMWSHRTKEFFELILVELLPPDRITWIPNIDNATDVDPLKIMLERAKVQPSARWVTEVIIDYCVKHATQSRNLSFLGPVFMNIRLIMELYPDKAIQQLARVAYMPAPQRNYILNNHIIAHPPSMKLLFWKSEKIPLTKMPDPIMQFHFSDSKDDPANDAFTREVFMASFDALWEYKNRPAQAGTRAKSKPVGKNANAKPTHLNDEKALYTGVDPDGPTEEDEEEVGEATAAVVVEEHLKTNKWKVLYYMLGGIFHLKTHIYVESYDFSLEYFDNPAIAALVAYKW